MHNHQLNVSIHPADWIDTIISTYTHFHKKITTTHELSIKKLCTWSNEEEKLMLIGTAVKYPTFKDFTPQYF